jgi:hypothetical protein
MLLLDPVSYRSVLLKNIHYFCFKLEIFLNVQGTYAALRTQYGDFVHVNIDYVLTPVVLYVF